MDRAVRVAGCASAAVQGLLYVVHVLHWWEAVLLALVAVAIWWFVGRDNRSDTVRQASWIFATSQLLLLCIPIALAVLSAIAIGVVAVLAVVALYLLFSRRP